MKQASVVRCVIAGLVVGAMGVFVFSVALGQWLKERMVGADGKTPSRHTGRDDV